MKATESLAKKALLVSLSILLTPLSSIAVVGHDITPDYSIASPVHSVVVLAQDGQGLCHGLVVGPRSILTAKHCAESTIKEIVAIFPKAGEAVSAQPSKETTTIKVKNRFFPSSRYLRGFKSPNLDYDPSEDPNSIGPESPAFLDLAVVELVQSVPANIPIFNIADLADDRDLEDNLLIGFGYQTEKIRYEKDTLQQLILAENKTSKVASSEELESLLGRRHECEKDGQERCAAFAVELYGRTTQTLRLLIESENQICQGDSGGPTFAVDKRGRYKLVGVLSGGTSLRPEIWVSERMIGCSREKVIQNVKPLAAWLYRVIK